MNNPEKEVVEQKIRRATAINALRKIGLIVAEEQKTEARQEQAWRWMLLLGLLILLFSAALLGKSCGVI